MRHIFILFALFLPSLLAAQHSPATGCRDAKTTVDMERCASRDLDQAKRELDRYLQEARRLATNRALLDSAQAVWEHYRDVACRAAGSEYEGGTVKPLVMLNCLTDLARDRMRELYDHYLRTSNTPLPEPKH
jgi:uncharacterized protein YecT (DUF1311 family)